MDVSNLTFPPNTFTTVIDTFSLCVFPDPSSALKEIARVVKGSSHGGRVLLLENSRSEWGPVGWYQDVTGGVVAEWGGKGCRYNQDVKGLVQQAGMMVVEEKSIVGGLFRLVEAVRKDTRG